MRHYRQIIIDLAVEDDTPEQTVTEWKDDIKKYLEGVVDPAVAKVVEVKVN